MCPCIFKLSKSIGGAKALLSFAQGKEITKENKGDFWLAVHGANQYGNDKVSFEEQSKMGTEDNTRLDYKCAKTHLTNRQWEEASHPFQFLSLV